MVSVYDSTGKAYRSSGALVICRWNDYAPTNLNHYRFILYIQLLPPSGSRCQTQTEQPWISAAGDTARQPHLFRNLIWCPSGRPEEFHLQSPTDPYVNLSIHTAPTSLALGTSRPQADAGSRTAPPSLLVGQDFLSLYPFTGNRCPPPKRVLIRVLKLSPFGVKHLKNGLSIIRDRNSLIFG